jgi:hypothetical protein
MIWIIPSPVRSSLIVIVKNPLKPFKISIKQLSQFTLSRWLSDIKLKLLFVIVSFGFIRVLFVSVYKAFHEIMILFNSCLGFSFD